MKKAMVAMSGGVDSSVAAYLTKEAGYETMGVTMKLYENETAGICSDKTCCSLSDVEDARSVAFDLDIPYYVFNFTGDFQQEVIDRFIRAYETGETPNPCIDCNRFIKFEKLMERGRELMQDIVVTGHYAVVEHDEGSGRHLLKKSVDCHKDQTYVLYSLTQEQLAHVWFPVGGMTKEKTREIAEANGFVNAKKHESQDICFVPDGDYAAFIRRFTGKAYPPGDFVNREGKVLGRHKGMIKYTIGQRKGLGLALPHPMYVVEKDLEHNRVILGENEDLFRSRFKVEGMNWISTPAPGGELKVAAKVRYSQQAAEAIVHPLSETEAIVEFEKPQRAITPGQACVLYDGEYVVGGGTITGLCD